MLATVTDIIAIIIINSNLVFVFQKNPTAHPFRPLISHVFVHLHTFICHIMAMDNTDILHEIIIF